MRHFLSVLSLLLFISTLDAQAQQRRFRGGSVETPVMRALPMDLAPTLDGRVRSDPAWNLIPASTGFTQTAPNDGQPATEKTEVRIGFTNETLYVGVTLFDSDPSGLITADTRRDSQMGNSDSFRFILDTFSDGQNGFVFGTNAAGAEYDAQYAGSSGGGGSGGRMSGGSGGGLNVNWDSSWEVVASVNEDGWSAEFAIPFTTIRYPKGDNQIWGVNFERTIRRNNETAFWAPLE
ncbi:carbohydrate binding family 9 domain-containing protein [bacterium]|nr:carbohydrate binding family 9 domain-containing protein [bacterium]